MTGTASALAERQGPAGAVTFEDGSRFYPVGDQKFWSVTTALEAVGKDAMKFWAAIMAAETAFLELPTIVTASRVKPCGRTYNRCKHEMSAPCERCPCGVCAGCVQRWVADRHLRESSRRSDEGIRTHDFIEWWAGHAGERRPFDPDIAPYIAAFDAFCAEYGLLPESFLFTEVCGINRAHRYAGTLDGIIRFRARATPAAAKLVARVLGITEREAVERDATVDLLIDFKTREDEGARFWPEQALQVTAYRKVETVRIKNTDFEEPMPATDGGVLIQLRPDGCTPRLVVADDETFEAFLNYLRGWQWLAEKGSASVSAKAFPLRKDEPKPKTAPAKKAPARAARSTGRPAGRRADSPSPASERS